MSNPNGPAGGAKKGMGLDSDKQDKTGETFQYNGVQYAGDVGEHFTRWTMQLHAYAEKLNAVHILAGIEENLQPPITRPEADLDLDTEEGLAQLRFRQEAEDKEWHDQWKEFMSKDVKLQLAILHTIPESTINTFSLGQDSHYMYNQVARSFGREGFFQPRKNPRKASHLGRTNGATSPSTKSATVTDPANTRNIIDGVLSRMVRNDGAVDANLIFRQSVMG